MTKTVTYTCEITFTQTKDLEGKMSEENTCLVELEADDERIQHLIDTDSKVAVASTGQILSIAVASIIKETCVITGLSSEEMLAEFMTHVATHLTSGGERMDPAILKFKIVLP